MILLLSVLVTYARGAFSGSIATDNDEISSTGVTYTFTLSFTSTIPSDGKLTLRFPANYTESFSSPVCTAISGFTSAAGTDLDCEYLDSIRLLTID